MDVFEGKIWISNKGLTETCIGVENGIIKAVKNNLKGDQNIRFEGIMLPSALDMHVHVRDPGNTHKDDWSTCS